MARTIFGEESAHDEEPFFWSDQFGMRLQYVGFASESARLEKEEGTNDFCARYFDRDGRRLAALVANRPSEIAALRRELKANAISSTVRRSTPRTQPLLARR